MRFVELEPGDHFTFDGKEYVKISPGRADRVENNITIGPSRDFGYSDEIEVLRGTVNWFSTM